MEQAMLQTDKLAQGQKNLTTSQTNLKKFEKKQEKS